MTLKRFQTAVMAGLLVTSTFAPAAVLWQIGTRDRDNGEFALAPKGYHQFGNDGFFVVGRSDAKRDWPYVHPGPHDTWAGGAPHTFTIAFGVKSAPAAGECKLVIDLIDTQARSAPELRIDINGTSFKRKLPGGAGDDSVFGQPAKGKPYRLELSFPANLLKSGANAIDITTVSGSWMLYDAVTLEGPAQVALSEVRGTVLSTLRSQPALVERGGKLFQTVTASIRHFGDPSAGRVLVNGVEATNLNLQPGAQSVELLVPAVEQITTMTAAVQVAGQAVVAQTLALAPVRQWVVYLLPHSHVDIGYTHVQTDVERAQWKYLEMAMDAAQRSAGYPEGARFKWNVEVLWAVDGYLRQATPEKQQRFIDAVKAGWIGLEALYGNELTGLCRPEELLRLTSFAQKLAQRCDVPIQSAMITDVPGYTWGVVPAFAHSGVKYFSIGPNGGDRIGHTIAAWGDKPFWWIGPNGRDKLLVWMTGTGYYQVFQSPEKLMGYLGGLEQKGYPYNFVQVRHCLGDNGAPDVNFADKVKAWNETHAYPKLVIATADEMFRAFEQRYGDLIPKVSGDFTPYWEDGAASSARETALNRGAAERLVQAETLWAMIAPDKFPAPAFSAAWRNVVLYDEHTWGAHNSISQPDAPFVKSQWAIKQAFALEADKQSQQLLERAIELRGVPGAMIESIDVFNTTSWPRTDVVLVPKDWALPGDAVRGPEGEPVYAQRLSSGEFAFLARNVPPFAARRYSVSKGPAFSPGSAKVNGNTLTTSRLAVRIDPETGGIASLRSIELGVELVNAKSQSALNDYFYLPGADLKQLKRNGPVKISVKEKGPLLASLLVESDAPGCRKLTREVRVIEGVDRVDLVNVVDKLPVRAKEGVHFGFGFNVPEGEVRVDVPWGVVRPETDQIPGACKNWFTLQRWIDVANDVFGVTLASPDAPLMQVGGITANVLGSANDLNMWRKTVEPTQTVYSWAMNNHWHTNYRAEQEGPTTFRFSLAPHGKFSSDSATRFGASLTQPLIAMAAQGSTPMSQSRLAVRGEGVLVSAFKPSDDGKALIVRLFGAGGKPGHVTLDWSAPAPKKVCFSDNSERAGAVAGDSIDVPGHSIVTLRAE